MTVHTIMALKADQTKIYASSNSRNKYQLTRLVALAASFHNTRKPGPTSTLPSDSDVDTCEVPR